MLNKIGNAYPLITIFGLLLVLGSCKTLSPIRDTKESPVRAGVYSMEIDACGIKSTSGAACVYQKGTDVSGEIAIRVPRTNTTDIPATLELVSVECNYKKIVLGIPGQTISIPVTDIMGEFASKSCSVQVNMTVIWDKQSSFTFPVSPLVGRVLIFALEHPLIQIHSGAQFPVLGFVSYDEIASFSFLKSSQLVLDSQGSSFGQILYAGCGIAVTKIPYQESNPSFSVPKVSSSCLIFGTLQTIDKPGMYSFAIAVNVIPGSYLNLATPVLMSEKGGESDPEVSAVDFGESVARGGKFTIPKNLRGTEYDIRQITTSGRFSVSHVKNDIVEWSLP